jgi:hypothetical protein
MDYVYASFGGTVLYAPTGAVEMSVGDVWFADDPFVAERPDLFSQTPPVVRTTVGKDAPAPTALTAKRRKRA